MGTAGELLVAAVFFLVFKFWDIYAATASAMVTQTVVTLYDRWVEKAFRPFSLAALAIVWFMGGLTLVLHDETFVKMKPSVLYLLVSGTLLVSRYWWKVNLMEQALEKVVNHQIKETYCPPPQR